MIMDAGGQEFRQGAPGMAHLCSVMSEASAGITQEASGWLDTLFPQELSMWLAGPSS